MKPTLLNRRRFLQAGALAIAAVPYLGSGAAGEDEPPRRLQTHLPDVDVDDRVRGLLLGSLIGDALGGPIEFQDPGQVAKLDPPPKRWQEDEILDDRAVKEAADRLLLRPYGDLRPKPEPYAHWAENAPPGTLTDDSRHKIILLDALREAHQRGAWPFDARALARAYLGWPNHGPVQDRPELLRLRDEWLREWNLASRWLLGERDPARALPPERLWSGLPTCCGQMTLLPVAALFPGQPERAYRAAYSLAYFDNGWGRDLNAGLVAALSKALAIPADEPRGKAWEQILTAMRETDPYRYREIPWVPRATDRWLDLALAAARAAARRPARLFARLDEEFQHTIKWEAQVPFVVMFAVLALCDFDPLAALQLSIEWGHDTDSYAQLVGAYIGALHGAGVFPQSLRKCVLERLRTDYDADLEEWVERLRRIREATDKDLFPPLSPGDSQDEGKQTGRTLTPSR